MEGLRHRNMILCTDNEKAVSAEAYRQVFAILAHNTSLTKLTFPAIKKGQSGMPVFYTLFLFSNVAILL